MSQEQLPKEIGSAIKQAVIDSRSAGKGRIIVNGREIDPMDLDKTIYEILQYPDPILSKPCEPVTEFNDELLTLIGDMFATMRAVTWGRPVGLAAPQIGKSIQLFIANGQVFINPVITWKTKAPESIEKEGCYSKKANEFKDIRRCPSIRVTWQDENNVLHDERFNGFKAHVIQHEYDHLNLK